MALSPRVLDVRNGVHGVCVHGPGWWSACVLHQFFRWKTNEHYDPAELIVLALARQDR